jgi:hypothetical protein
MKDKQRQGKQDNENYRGIMDQGKQKLGETKETKINKIETEEQ